MTRAAFWPPKPKLVEMAVRTGKSRALFGTGEAIVQVAPVVERRRRLERVRIAQPRRPGAAATERTVLKLDPVRLVDRSLR